MVKSITIRKRTGDTELLNVDKIHKVVDFACDGVTGVSPSDVIMAARITFFDGITSKQIHQQLVNSAAGLISEKTPNYQIVAGRLLMYDIRKDAWGRVLPPRLYDHIVKMVQDGYYTSELLTNYTEKEWDSINTFIKHDRDFDIMYIGVAEYRTKYAVRDRSVEEIRPLETPQFTYILAAVIMSGFSKNLAEIKKIYNTISTFKISLPTPIMAGLRTPTKQFSSCVLIDTDDTLDSIISTTGAIIKYISKKAGIGINASALRSEGSSVAGNTIKHTGEVPFYRLFESAVKSCSQGGVRGGAATLYFPMWTLDFEDLIVLKNNKGTPETRVRKLDYGVQINDYLYNRLITKGNITLFSSDEVPGLHDAFFSNKEEFARLYEKYEKSTKIRKKVYTAAEIFTKFIIERKDTGRIYVLNVDNANDHSPFVEPIKMSNLCVSGETIIDVLVNGSNYKGPIESFAATVFENDVVYIKSYNEQTGEIEYNKIVEWAKTSNSAETITIIDHATRKHIKCTPWHKIYTVNRGWVEAKDLLDTDQLFVDGSGVTSSLEIVTDTKNIPVYDLHVEKVHNFFANDILVHNCAEILLPTVPLKHLYDENGRIALCTLLAINMGMVKDLSELEDLMRTAVFTLDNILDYQDFPLPAAREATIDYRPLGIGVINLAYYLAKHDAKYGDEKALQLTHEFFEAMQYYGLKASVELAKIKGTCRQFKNTKYAKGLLPIDHYNKNLDKVITHPLKLDWESLRKDIVEFGLRNICITALMPSESSSKIANATNGVEPIRSLVVDKSNKSNISKQVAPEATKLKNKYDYLWDMRSMDGVIKTMAVIQKFVDQSISTNLSYNPEHWDNNEIPLSVLLKDVLKCNALGIKTLYYHNTNDNRNSEMLEKDIIQAQVEDMPSEEIDCDSCKI